MRKGSQERVNLEERLPGQIQRWQINLIVHANVPEKRHAISRNRDKLRTGQHGEDAAKGLKNLIVAGRIGCVLCVSVLLDLERLRRNIALDRKTSNWRGSQ
jgi:hypothetical protein